MEQAAPVRLRYCKRVAGTAESFAGAAWRERFAAVAAANIAGSAEPDGSCPKLPCDTAGMVFANRNYDWYLPK